MIIINNISHCQGAKKIWFIFIVVLISIVSTFFQSNAQIVDSFNDGDFSDNPLWTGDTSNFTVLTPHTIGDGGLPCSTDGLLLGSKPNCFSSALFTSSSFAYGEWRFSMAEGRGWAVSGANDYFVVLISDSNDPDNYRGNLNFNGYYLRFDGSANDKFILYRQQGYTKTVVIDTHYPSNNDGTATVPRSFKIIRSNEGLWTIFIDNHWDITATTICGSATDNTITESNFFGIVTNISTPSSSRIVWFDNLYCGNVVVDIDPPVITEATPININTVSISFNEAVDSTTAFNKANYTLNYSEIPTAISFVDSENKSLLIAFEHNFPLSDTMLLTISNISDLAGNVMTTTTLPLFYAPPQPGDIVINEIFFDPYPSVNLPDYDYLELYNRRTYPISMKNWKLQVGTKTISFPEFTIPPYSHLIITSTAGYETFLQYGTVLGLLSTTDLTNTGKEIILRDTLNTVIHSIAYNNTFYNDPNKVDGGWSIEQIDPNGWCQQNKNWHASIDATGGTPGRINSVIGTNIDTVPPRIEATLVRDTNKIMVIFDEQVTEQSASNIENYRLVTGPKVKNVEYNGVSNNTVTLTLTDNLTENTEYLITVSNIEDYCSNILSGSEHTIRFSVTKFGDVVFNEIMCNPSSHNNLQTQQYIELYNNHSHSINTYMWQIKSGNTSYSLPAITIAPHGYLILKQENTTQTIQNNVTEISLFSPTFLSKTGKTVELYDSHNKLIHWVRYTNLWYKDELKKIGGWALEQIDPTNYCAGTPNWSSSSSPTGGTPGAANSVKGTFPDNNPPEILYLTVDTDSSITLHFNEPLLLTNILDQTGWKVDEYGLVDSIQTNSPSGEKVSLLFNKPLKNNTLYTVETRSIHDCVGNTTQIPPKRFELPNRYEQNSLVINEILFNPFDGSSEFIELYNKGNEIIALNNIYASKLDTDGNAEEPKLVSNYGHLLYPHDYLVLSNSRKQIFDYYPFVDTLKVVETSALPSLPDKSGSILFINQQGYVIEQFEYSETMHTPMIKNRRGVSLERISPYTPAQNISNWQSASSTSGYATPTYKNSQYSNSDNQEAMFSVSTDIISPDNDGIDDYLLIEYNFTESGNTLNIRIFDTYGRMVKELVQNHFAGTSGQIKWDGTNNNNMRTSVGPYIINIEFFNTKGYVQKKNIVVTVAKR